MEKVELEVKALLGNDYILYVDKDMYVELMEGSMRLEDVLPYLTTEITGITVENINQFVKYIKEL
jgi:hypothetical protein